MRTLALMLRVAQYSRDSGKNRTYDLHANSLSCVLILCKNGLQLTSIPNDRFKKKYF